MTVQWSIVPLSRDNNQQGTNSSQSAAQGLTALTARGLTLSQRDSIPLSIPLYRNKAITIYIYIYIVNSMEWGGSCSESEGWAKEPLAHRIAVCFAREWHVVAKVNLESTGTNQPPIAGPPRHHTCLKYIHNSNQCSRSITSHHKRNPSKPLTGPSAHLKHPKVSYPTTSTRSSTSPR